MNYDGLPLDGPAESSIHDVQTPAEELSFAVTGATASSEQSALMLSSAALSAEQYMRPSGNESSSQPLQFNSLVQRSHAHHPAEEDMQPLAADATDSEALDPSLPPDHPLLARAQAALQRHLLDTKRRLQEELRESTNALKVYPISCCAAIKYGIAHESCGSPPQDCVSELPSRKDVVTLASQACAALC